MQESLRLKNFPTAERKKIWEAEKVLGLTCNDLHAVWIPINGFLHFCTCIAK